MSETIVWSQLSPNERDALIAQHIFKRNIVAWKEDRVLLMARVGSVGHEAIPPYSTSMDAAWQIVEKLAEQFNVRVFAESGMLSKHNVMVFDKDYGECQGHGYSDISMPDAVCLAALKAYKIEVEV